MPPLLTSPTLQDALQQQDTVLTPNQRLSRKILATYANSQQQHGARAWLTPLVSSLEGWIKQQWQQLQDSGDSLGQALLLDNRQELQLWQQCLDQDPDTQLWLQPAGAARHASQALKTLQLWRQHPQSEQLQPYLDDTYVLERWHQTFRLGCQPLRAITFCDAVERLIQAFERRVLTQQPRCWRVGFQDIPPLYQALLTAAFELHQPLDAEMTTGHCQRLPCDTLEQEIEQAAQWTRQILQRAPGARIAIIDPELSSRRSLHERAFRQQLEPQRLFQDSAVEAPLFNMSIGSPLAHCPVIDTAFLLLSLISRPLQLDDLPALLYCPFIAGTEQELEFRIQLEQKLRRLGLTELTVAQLQQQLTALDASTEDSAAALPATDAAAISQTDSALATLLRQLLKFQRQPKRTPSHWGRWAVKALSQLGWPGPRQASSLEHQQISQWYDLLGGFGRFDAILTELSYSDGLRLLRSESQSCVFQPQTPDSAVQILGPLEAAGLQFTHLWVLGLSDERWPVSPNLNPLLPAAYQQMMQMPHSSADRELNFARQLTQLFASSAEQVVFSHPQRQDDQILRPSALISQYPAVILGELILTSKHSFSETAQLPLPAQLQSDAAFELIDSGTAPPVNGIEREQLRGGSAILTNQSLCPFSAFAIHRLGAKPLDQPQTGLSHADRGNLLHNVLEYIWQQLPSQQALMALAPETLRQLLTQATEHAIKPFRSRAPRWMGDRFWQLEQQRLQALTERWLELEQQRPPFSIAAVEKTLNTELQGMPMRLRIDRVDRLADGSELLIDYKSGTPNVADWFGERPRQPQLPLYSYATRHPVSALAFGQVNASEVAFKGITAEQAPAAGIKSLSQYRNAPCDDWDQMTQLWQQTLERLMTDFLHGATTVSPLDPNVYQYSQLQPLNRYYELERLGQTQSRGHQAAQHAAMESDHAPA